MADRLGCVGIVGVGLIGASIGMALRQRAVAGQVVGVDIDAQAVAAAREIGALDAGGTDLGALRPADLVVVAVPPDAVVGTAVQAAAVMKKGSILTDVASTKAEIVRALDERLAGRVRYIGGHPMAGSEGQGPRMADPTLLPGRPFLLTPTDRTDPAAVSMMTELAERLGMLPVLLSPDDHDDLVAQISHLPYLLAAAVVGAASDRAISIGGPAFSGLGRIARGPVKLWVQICRSNRTAIRRALGQFRRELDGLERALDGEEPLEILLQRSRRRAPVDGLPLHKPPRSSVT
jgi:prephenate dehydrogenase